eukprot:4683786-Prymnesium_polylepis.2
MEYPRPGESGNDVEWEVPASKYAPAGQSEDEGGRRGARSVEEKPSRYSETAWCASSIQNCESSRATTNGCATVNMRYQQACTEYTVVVLSGSSAWVHDEDWKESSPRSSRKAICRSPIAVRTVQTDQHEYAAFHPCHAILSTSTGAAPRRRTAQRIA